MKEVTAHRKSAVACIIANVFLATVMIALLRVADVRHMPHFWTLNALQLLVFVVGEAQALALLSLEKGRAIWPTLVLAHAACLLATVVAMWKIVFQPSGRM